MSFSLDPVKDARDEVGCARICLRNLLLRAVITNVLTSDKVTHGSKVEVENEDNKQSNEQ